MALTNGAFSEKWAHAQQKTLFSVVRLRDAEGTQFMFKNKAFLTIFFYSDGPNRYQETKTFSDGSE